MWFTNSRFWWGLTAALGNYPLYDVSNSWKHLNYVPQIARLALYCLLIVSPQEKAAYTTLSPNVSRGFNTIITTLRRYVLWNASNPTQVDPSFDFCDDLSYIYVAYIDYHTIQYTASAFYSILIRYGGTKRRCWKFI